MKFYTFATAQHLAQHLAQELLTLIARKPKAVLGLATGSTMEPVYAEILRQNLANPVNVQQLSTFNLDEYLGLAPEHPHSYNYYMHQHLFHGLGLAKHQVHLPQGNCADPDLECANYTAAIAAAGGLDFQLLGIGGNGHIGFNEPGTAFDTPTHCVELTAQTREDNSRLFDNPAEIPSHALTMGMAEIMQAKEVVLVITGAHKADIAAALATSQPCPALPASALKQHPNARVYLDAAAASQLQAGTASAVA